MLYIVLVLVLAALGLLVTALITASSLWAWVSIGLSVLAGLILIVDWLRRRRRSEVPSRVEAEEAEAEPSVFAESTAPEDEEQTVLLPAAGELGDPAGTPAPEHEPEPPEEVTAVAPAIVADEPVDKSADTTIIEPVAEREGAEPGEEQSSAEDIAIVSDLDDEIAVVDEFPRYHLTACGWLAGRDTIPIGVGEARQLGFTPCARCRPDAALAAAHRGKSKAEN